MDLSALIAWLRDAVDKHGEGTRWVGLAEPHSYRGYYEDLSLEIEETTLGASLRAAEDCVGTTFTGWSGGDYVMDNDTRVWCSPHGTSGGSQISALMLDGLLLRALAGGAQ